MARGNLSRSPQIRFTLFHPYLPALSSMDLELPSTVQPGIALWRPERKSLSAFMLISFVIAIYVSARGKILETCTWSLIKIIDTHKENIYLFYVFSPKNLIFPGKILSALRRQCYVSEGHVSYRKQSIWINASFIRFRTFELCTYWAKRARAHTHTYNSLLLESSALSTIENQQTSPNLPIENSLFAE